MTTMNKRHPPSVLWFIAGAITGCFIPLGIGILAATGVATITKGNTDSAKHGGIVGTMIPLVIITCLIIIL